MKRKKQNVNLTLFFTGGVSLKTWAKTGNLDRETALYKKLSLNLKEVSFVTYGGKQDKKFLDRLNNIKLLPVQWHRREINTVLELMLKYYPELRKINVLKTNQIAGAEIPLWFKKRFGKKLITRCGYLHSYCTKRRTKDKKTIKEAVQLEQKAFSSADLGIVTAKWQRDIVVKNYNIDPEKIKIIPNYVVTDIFKPYPGFKKEFDLIYIGRSKENKNLRNLLKALNSLKRKDKKLSLLLIGESYRDKRLRETALQYNLNVTFKDNLPNFKLPLFLNKCRAFILPSLYEGHPKSLIEAMSCGLPCIGCNVTGVNEVIDHMETGYLCNTDHESIAEAIDAVLGDKTLCRYIGENARSFILNNYSLDKIFKLELAAIRKVLGV
jgi:glycosyltransferase involved in cell wall biosynthesis